MQDGMQASTSDLHEEEFEEPASFKTPKNRKKLYGLKSRLGKKEANKHSYLQRVLRHRYGK